jgi:PPOX class probable F420-dependent enzyme
MELSDALVLARANREAVLTTIRGNGLPQLSNVLQAVGDDGLVRVSTTADRAKAKNLARRPWAAVHVNGDTFFSYAVLEGDAELSPVAESPDDATVDELVDLYRSLVGEHEDWAAYRKAMVEERRLVVRIRPTRAYGMARLPRTSGT